MLILAFESSCDDTSVALLEVLADSPRVVAMAVQSQFDIHEKFGGVVPELASRAHLSNLLPCVEKVLATSGHRFEEIDIFAATEKPGLIGCLLIGHTAAKTLSLLYKKPFVSCNHIESHLMSAFIENQPPFPFLCLVVSGGHTSLYLVQSMDAYQVVAQAIDDAAGEAFDKGAKLLGLPLPGGPGIDRLARKGDRSRYAFGKVKVDRGAFSFSGLKSEFARLVLREGSNLKKEDAAASYQEAILDHIFDQVMQVADQTQIQNLVFVGGVAANSRLRERARELQMKRRIAQSYFPSLEYCTDNAAMVGLLAHRKFLRGEISDLTSDVVATTRPPRKKSKMA